MELPKYTWQHEFISGDQLALLREKTCTRIDVRRKYSTWNISITGIGDGLKEAKKEIEKIAKLFSVKIYFLSNDLSVNGWGKEDESFGMKERSFQLELISLKKKDLRAEILKKSGAKHIDIEFFFHTQPRVTCYGSEEEILKAGFAIDNIVQEYREFVEERIDLKLKAHALRLMGPSGTHLRQLELDSGCAYTSILYLNEKPKLLVRGSSKAVAKAREHVLNKLQEFAAEDEEKQRVREEERIKRQQEWEEQQKLLALRNRRRPRKPVK
eukprot:TRINITY_DN128_c1_g3_i1.p1 TRINITY_DN128_c1_g3~~TRINITY_DN128_c1_g3_i1.p1  ORF type:complete len:316 (-),score=99.30 TRINITY_DN128_c1_g3_i1:25-831(-)